MGKIDDFEQKLIKQGMTDEDFIEYEKLLKRVRGNSSKCQHCYTTAIQFPRKYAEQAINLIQYGLDNFYHSRQFPHCAACLRACAGCAGRQKVDVHCFYRRRLLRRHRRGGSL